jgi:tRNA(fMet)-specific endonuclease VapC
MAVRVLDTNIVSYMYKGHPLAARYRPHVVGHTLAVAFMTVAELYEGALRAKWGRARWRRLDALLQTFLIVRSDPNLCRFWADIRAQRRRQPIGVADAWIAAVALAEGADLITHNPADFQGISGLHIITEAP